MTRERNLTRCVGDMIIGRKLLNLVTNKVNLEILSLLRNEPSYPRMLAEILGKDETHISKRLRMLERAGIVTGEWRRVGGKNVRLYSLNTERIEIIFDLEGCKVQLKPKEGERMLIVTAIHNFRVPPPANFVGRKAELEMLESEKNFFIIEGMAGIGKTSLASKYAEEVKRTHRVFWHSMKEVDSLNYLMNKLAIFLSRHQYLELLNYLKSGGSDDSVKMALLLKGIDREGYVVILDDYHRCRDEKIDILLRYLQKNLRRARVLVLSRVRPRFFSPLDPNVTERRLTGLNTDETLELLTSRGLRVSRGEAEEIQRRLSGHPLALNMLCETLNGRAIEEVLEGLPERGLLEYFWDEVYQSLEEEERTLLRCMSVFRYPVPVRAIMAVSKVKGVRGILYSLERKMLIWRSDEGYHLHEVIRNLSYNLLEDAEEMHKRAAEYYLSEGTTEGLLEAIYHMIKAGNFMGAADAIREDLKVEGRNCIERGYMAQYLELLKKLPKDDLNEQVWCWILYGRGRVHLARGEFQKAIRDLTNSLMMAERCSDRVLTARALKHLGKAYLGMGDVKMAETCFIRSLKLLKELGNLGELGGTYLEAALPHIYKGDLETAEELLNSGLRLCRRAGDVRSLAVGYYHYAGLYEMRNDWEKAKEICEEGLRVFEDLGDILWVAILNAELAFIKSFLHSLDEALEHYDRCIETFKETGLYTKLVEAYSDRALLLMELGDLEGAERDCGEALKLRDQLGSFSYYGVTYRALGILATLKGKWIEAEEHFKRSIELLSPLHQFHLAETHIDLASLYRKMGRNEEAKKHLKRASSIFERLGSKVELERVRKMIEELGKEID